MSLSTGINDGCDWEIALAKDLPLLFLRLAVKLDKQMAEGFY
jgi:hypothetical protein